MFAAKPASWPKVLVPALLGQAIGLEGSSPSWGALAIGIGFTFLDVLFIVFLNDWGDRDVDRIKRHMFPHSSRKTIPDQVLPARALLLAGVLAGALAVGVAFAGGAWLERPWLGPLGGVALAIFLAYSLPPLRLNYRGGGELLEMLGLGVLLPCLHAYLQSGSLALAGLWLLPGWALFSLASAIASGLSDERSDRRGGKRTVVTVTGNLIGRRLVEALALAGAMTWLAVGVSAPSVPAWVAVPAALVGLFHAGATIAASGAAGTDRFEGQRRYKAALHRAMWRSALLLCILVGAWHRI